MRKTGCTRTSRIRTAPSSKVISRRGCGTSVMWTLTGRCDAGDDGVEQAVGSLSTDLGFRPQQEAMAEGWTKQPFHVIRRHVIPPVERRGGLGSEHQEHLGPRTGAQHQLGRLAGGDREPDDVPPHLLL